MEKILFRFVKQVASLAQKLTDAALIQLSDPAGNGFTGWKHAVLLKHRVFEPYDHAHNARIDDERYHQRSTTESVNSSLKRSHGSAVRARDWFRQFREIALIAGVHNVKQAIES